MEFRLLGPLEAVEGEARLTLGSRKARALLARLLLDANRTVSVQRLVDDLWGDDVPESAPKMVQINVSLLRKVLPAGVLRTQAPGYLVEVAPDALDLSRFSRMRLEGRAALEAGDAAAAAELLAGALGLWRGPALAEFSEPFARIEGAHLEELRLGCLEDRIEADLAAGRHDDVAGELEALTAQHPLRERLHRQQILALYRAGRQAEALEAYERFRRALDDRLGIEPSPALKRLQHRILTQDPGLEPGAGSVAGKAVDARPKDRVAPGAAGAPRPVPPRTRAAAARPAHGAFVGREDELAQLEMLLEAAGDGDGTTVLIRGRAGIGKSRLAAELGRRARARGGRVLEGRCIQLAGMGLPYLPFADALRPLAGVPAVTGLAGQLHELPRLIPDLAAGGDAERAELDRTESRLRLFQEVFMVLERLSSERPLVLVLEDLHWADASTLDLLAFLAYGVARTRVLVLGTYRTEEVEPGDPLQRLASGLVAARVAVSLELEPLDRDEVAALVRASGAASAPEALVDTIFARSEGNPLFAKQLLAAASRGEASLPPALRDMLLADVARLGANGRSALRIAAAAGRDAPYDLFCAVTPLDDLELAEALRDAVEHDLLVPDQAVGTFRFRHALFAEAVYETLLPGEREVLHERIARALTAEPALAMSGAAAAECAHHWLAARRPAEALAASLEAATEAERVSGLSEALGHVERVLALWDEVPDAEALAGVALPAILSRAAELAGTSTAGDDEMDLREVVGVLDFAEPADAETVAERLGVAEATAETWLAALEHAGLVARVDGGYRAAPLAMSEANRLYPAAVVLESVAVRRSPPFGEAQLQALREANASFRAASGDAAAASVADDEFHRLLVADCGNDEIVAALLPIKRALLRYELVYMADPERIERSADKHDAIVAALEGGNHAEAAQLLRENLAGGLPDLTDAVEHPELTPGGSPAPRR
jgi:DNA-binding SARP family transcriptional activator/DNA-binding GntR family transcriptional regulator